MIYPQSLSHRISKWLGLYGTVANSAGTSETLTVDTDFSDLTWTADLLIGDSNSAIPTIFDTMSNYLVVDGTVFDVSSTTNTAGTASTYDLSFDNFTMTKAVYSFDTDFYSD